MAPRELNNDRPGRTPLLAGWSFVLGHYNDDPCESFEISEVRAFLKGLDAQWPY